MAKGVSDSDRVLLLAACEEKVAWAQRIGASFTPGQVNQMADEVFRAVSSDYHNGHSGYGDGGGDDNEIAYRIVRAEIERLIKFLKET